MQPDTIVALSSPPGASPRAVVRLSGPEAHALARTVAPDLPASGRRARWAAVTLRLPEWPAAPAEAVLFTGPRSYTGEDVVELWVPGAPPLLRAALARLKQAGARLADPGEFTRRAFLNGRLDLTQAEAVLALTTSGDGQVARAALRALEGGTRGPIDAVKEQLLQLMAHLEAAIDFSEEDLDLAAPADLAARAAAADQVLADLQQACARRPGRAERPVVVLRGPANAGKSSLFNRLTRRAGAPDAALVSDVAGTTRDVVAASWQAPGVGEVRLLDTAGDKETAGPVEARALAAAGEATASADLVLVVVDARDPAAAAPFLAAGRPTQVVLNKLDLLAEASVPAGALAVSARTGAGVAALAAAVAAAITGDAPAPELLGSARQDALLRAARAALSRAHRQLTGTDPARAELAAADLGDALDALGQLTGALTTEDVLDRLFASFCVGK